MARNKEEQNISDVLKAFVKKNKLEKGLNKVNVKEVWNTQMGPAIAKYTDEIQLNEKTLYVSLSSSVLREELSYGKSKIITMINNELGEELVDKLVLR
ncbi:DUF721 domain-containing protein [Mesonia ostreae]|uniref:DUF721 domain-containing protein n=1 Tax=Mesonia ostreae TaxID=861110 RepID=A0ABU2KLL3_9FLAO|nr:DUF721 domain-containing protein [Mesonia ostreae]MDT0295608.1 DUF721 domain-containing protein [Mesonia ostreae]